MRTALLFLLAGTLAAQTVVNRTRCISSNPDPITGIPQGWDELTSYHGGKLLNTHWTSSVFVMQVYNEDCTGGTDITTGLSGLPVGTSAGGGAFDPTGGWIVFQAQATGTTPNIMQPPGNGSSYDVYVVKWTGTATSGAAVKVSGATTATLWPRWNTDSTRISYTKYTGSNPDGGHHFGLWTTVTLSFNPSTGATSALTTCTPIVGAGLYETSTFTGTENLTILIQAGTGVYSQYNFVLYTLNTTTCSINQISDPNLWGWYEFYNTPNGSFPFSYFTVNNNRAAPPTGSNPFCNAAPSITPCDDVFVQASGGYPVAGTSMTKVAGCNTPGDPMYLGGIALFCAAFAWNSDGTKIWIQRQADPQYGGRESWLFTMSYPSLSLRLGGNLHLGGTLKLR